MIDNDTNENIQNLSPIDGTQSNIKNENSTEASHIDPPAADTAAAAVKRYEAQRARLKEQSDRRQQLLQEYRDHHRSYVDIMETTKSTVRSEKMS